MNVLIDAISIRRQKAGVGVYAHNLIQQLVIGSDSTHYFILAQDDDPDFKYNRRANVTVLTIPSRYFRSLPLRFLFEQIALPWLLIKHKIDVLHSLHYSFPLLSFGAKRVVTLHDLTSFHLASYHEPVKVVYFRFFIRAAVRLADAVIFVSYSAQHDCTSLLGVPKGLSVVVHHGRGVEFTPYIDSSAVEHIRAKYKLPARYVLYIGTIEPRKNLRTLVRAFETIATIDPDVSLVIAGMKGWNDEYGQIVELIQTLGLTTRVIFPGFVAEEDKSAILSAATVFVYPSLYEGFGLPVLEAMACGVPTITSNTSSLPEVAGDGALIVDPESDAAVGAALNLLLTNSTAREELRQRAIVQASRFSWQSTARQTAQVYHDVLQHGGSTTHSAQ